MRFVCICCGGTGSVSVDPVSLLTAQQLEIYEIVAKAKGAWVSADHIIYHLYILENDEPPNARNIVAKQIHSIRKRLGPVIEARRNCGYRFQGKVND